MRSEAPSPTKSSPVPALNAFDELARASSRIAAASDFSGIEAALVDQACDVTQSELAALYLEPSDPSSPLRLSRRRGAWEAPQRLARDDPAVSFIAECGEAAILHERRPCFLESLLLDPRMRSLLAVPLTTPRGSVGLLVVNSREAGHYGRIRFNFLTAFAALASGTLNNARLYAELKERAALIEALERYQESIFGAMSNLLLTADPDGSLHFFNDAAADAFGFSAGDTGKRLSDLLKARLSEKVVREIERSMSEGITILGIEGVAKGKDREIDFSLNLSPIRGKRSRRPDGHVLVFADQSRERELKARMDVVVEERRVIKDMFSRYLSEEVVSHLMETPALAGLGGSGKRATVFFADIRGYTSFSEGKKPEYIVEVLNDYFSEAVEIVAKRRGFIDKFIGDCIMAAWGVPMTSEEEDAINAVACAIEIQKLVADPERRFFRGEASHLMVGIGVHTGYLVAGNLGSPRRMNYSMIGDTVNVAARLEGVAAGGEVIITEDTRALLGDRFELEERQAVHVKGKSQAIRIYSAIDIKPGAIRRNP
ncbi:MAG: GAF domain-containing protein [Spirochaetales bacterium]|nr:GAF domain-containing protein [Spirochaetales bacterium]